jgi:hypothetical protein
MRQHAIKFLSLTLLAAFFSLSTSCARKKMSDRDSKREQVRNTADAKRKELSPAAGVYRGFLKQAGLNQDITLSLEIKDIPDTTTGEVDPVLVPILTGSLRLTFGSTETGEFYSYGIQKADFDANRKKVDIVVNNEQLKQIVMSLEQSSDGFAGTWNAPTLSASGEVELHKAADPLNLQASNTEMKGDYSGNMTWDGRGLYQLGLLTLSTSQDKPDSFAMSGNIKLINGDPTINEALVYSFDQIEFNPLTKQISLKGTASDVYFLGTFDNGKLLGSWYSKLHGKTGGAEFQKNTVPPAPNGLAQLMAVKGTYYGTFTNTNTGTHLPSKLMLSLVSYHDAEKSGGLAVSGNVRFYFGPFSSSEYIELPFDHIDYNFFTRNLDAKTSGSAKLSFEANVKQGVVSGKISDGALGQVGTFTATQTLPSDENFSMGGDYQGYLVWDEIHAFQNVVLNIQPTFSGDSSLKLSATAKLSFGAMGSGEQLVYKLDETEFNPTTGLAHFKSKDSEVSIKGYLENGEFEGEWITTIKGRMGRVEISKRARPTNPDGYQAMTSLKGSYQGALQNTSNQTNLPERFMIGLVTTPDLSSPRGIKISGNIRFYLGPFDSMEFVEAPCDSVQYDFYTRILAMKCAAPQIGGLSVKGDVGTSDVKGQIFHDSLGEIGKYEVTKQ